MWCEFEHALFQGIFTWNIMVFAKLQENILNKDFNKNMQKEISTFSNFKCKKNVFGYFVCIEKKFQFTLMSQRQTYQFHVIIIEINFI